MSFFRALVRSRVMWLWFCACFLWMGINLVVGMSKLHDLPAALWWLFYGAGWAFIVLVGLAVLNEIVFEYLIRRQRRRFVDDVERYLRWWRP